MSLWSEQLQDTAVATKVRLAILFSLCKQLSLLKRSITRLLHSFR